MRLEPAKDWPERRATFRFLSLVLADHGESAGMCTGIAAHHSERGTFVLTAAHCVARADRIECVIHESCLRGPVKNARRLAGEYIAAPAQIVPLDDPPGDVALLRIQAPLPLDFPRLDPREPDDAPLTLVTFDGLQGCPRTLSCRFAGPAWSVIVKGDVLAGQSGGGVFRGEGLVGILHSARDDERGPVTSARIVPAREIADWLVERGYGFIVQP